MPSELKSKRLQEIIDVQMKGAAFRTNGFVGQVHEVLVEGTSKKSDEHYFGRISQNTTIVFPKGDAVIGTCVYVKATDCTTVTLRGHIVDTNT